MDEQLQPCPKCNGTGCVVVRTQQFKVGDTVWWKARRSLWFYGYGDNPVPATVVAISPKRVRIRFKDKRQQHTYCLYIQERDLSIRSDSASREPT